MLAISFQFINNLTEPFYLIDSLPEIGASGVGKTVFLLCHSYFSRVWYAAQAASPRFSTLRQPPPVANQNIAERP